MGWGPRRTLFGTPQTLIINKIVASKFLESIDSMATYTYTNRKKDVQKEIDDAVSDQHAHQIADLPRV